MARSKSQDVSPAGRFGLFAMSPRRLQDLGLVKTVKKTGAESDKGGARNGKWTVTEWGPGMSEERFLGDPQLQVKVFRKSMREYAKAILELYKPAMGKMVGGKPVTLSGLLAVAHVCGIPGLDSWLKESKVREQFVQTTKAFMAATGIF